MQEFLHMGGYAFYVWSSYALALVILLATLISPILRRRQLLRRLADKISLSGNQS